MDFYAPGGTYDDICTNGERDYDFTIDFMDFRKTGMIRVLSIIAILGIVIKRAVSLFKQRKNKTLALPLLSRKN